MNEQPAAGRRVAFFGGSFDPPHLGHLAVARAAQTVLRLDSVLFAPVGAQPLKPLGSTATFAQRLAMTRLAIQADTGFSVSLADAPRPSGKPNYTLETLLALRAELPAESTLFCLMGADSFAGLRRWRRSAEIPFAASLIVASRPGEDLNDLRTLLPQGLRIEASNEPCESAPATELRRYLLRNPEGLAAPFYLLPGLEVEISASQIRQQAGRILGAESPGPALLPEAVTQYIRAHNLYR